jgi:hypothetical protein
MKLKICIKDEDDIIRIVGEKDFNPVSYQASKWVREEINKLKTYESPSTTNGIKIADKVYKNGCTKLVENNMGYFNNNSNYPYKNAQGVGLYSMGSSDNKGLSIIPTNVMKCCALFTARKAIKGNWINQKDEYSAPNINHVGYEQWNNDAVIYSLFNSNSNQSSLRNINYKGKIYNIKNEFFFISVEDMKKLSNEHNFIDMYRDIEGDENRFIFNLLQNIILSQDALEVLNEAKKLWLLSMGKREEYHNIYPEFNLQCWDAGWVQVKKLLKEYYLDELKKFREIYLKFEVRMRKGVYEFGFLPQEIMELDVVEDL